MLYENYRPREEVFVLKKDGSQKTFHVEKVILAVRKSAKRVLVEFTKEQEEEICKYVIAQVDALGEKELTIPTMHRIVEGALDRINPLVAKSYRDYRDYKQDFVYMLDDIYLKSRSIMKIGDKENAHTDSALVSTKRSLIFNQLNKALYQKFFMTAEEIAACEDGYIYIHDMSARRDTMNCCLFDVATVLRGGFEMGNIWYNEPKTLDVAFDVIGDIVLMAASQQYGGFTIPCVDELLAPYAEKSYQKQVAKYEALGVEKKRCEEQAYADVTKEFEQGFQGWEYKFNTIASSRGDYPFTTVTCGVGKDKFARLATISLLKVRRQGQGKAECKKPVLFPKIVFLYDEALHGPGGELEELFEAGVECSAKAMYPDWLSLSGEGYVAEIYQKYGKIISPMGCRAFLSPWFEKGGMEPADNTDEPIFVGRFNVGAVSLHLPMILAKSRIEGKDFYRISSLYSSK